jgi:flagellar motor switch protein FliN/FliY
MGNLAKFLLNKQKLGNLADVSVVFGSYLGVSKLSVREILELKEGSVIDLEKQAGESVEIFVNDRITGRGEVMVYDQNLAIRINEILDSKSVVKYFKEES